MDSRRSAALASYDGKLHAVYPHHKNVKLCHTTWTKDVRASVRPGRVL
ncbi:hypothetical protein ACFXD5_10715 [Streptomyces sp. NPDC059385]